MNFIILYFQYLVIVLTYVVILTFFGYITARLIGIKMRYQAVYSIASYAITLSTLLYTCYLIVNVFITFKIEYMATAYMAISYIYIITVIFILRSDIIKKHQELMKIMEEQKKVKQEIEQKKDEQKEEKKNEDTNNKKGESDNKNETDEEGLLDEKEENTNEPNGNEVN